MENDAAVTISIPSTLAGKLTSRMDEAGFDSLTSYVEFVLEQIIEEETQSNDVDHEAEESAVRERLKSMGYL